MGPLSRGRMDERRGIIAAAKTLKPERGKLLWNRHVLQLHVIGQSVLVRRRRLALDQRRNVCAAFRRDVKPVFGYEIARHHLFLVGDVGEVRYGDAPAIRLVRHPLDDRQHRVRPGKGEPYRGDAELVGLFDVHLGCNMAGGALQVVGERPVILVFQSVLDELRDDLPRAAQLRMAESVLQTGLGKEFPLPVAQALRHGDRAVPVAFHDSLDPLEELLLVELDLGKKEYLRRVAFPVGGEAAGCGDPPRVPAHYFHHEDPRRSLRHRGDVEPRFANRGRNVFRDRPETRAVVGDRKIVVDGLGNAHANERVSELFADLRDLPSGVRGIVAAVVEEEADVVGPEYVDQALVMCPVFIDTFQLVAPRAERATRRGLEPRDRRCGLAAGVDQVLGERTDDAVAAGVDLADAVSVLARGLDHARGTRVDDGGHPTRLSIERILGFHGTGALFERGENPVANLGDRADARDFPILRRARVTLRGPIRIVVHQRPRLLAVDLEALPDRLLPVVVALNQGLARNVVLARHLWRIEFDVVDASRSGMHPAPAHPLNDLVLGHVDLEHEVETDAGLAHRLRLGNGAWKTVEQVPVLAIQML